VLDAKARDALDAYVRESPLSQTARRPPKRSLEGFDADRIFDSLKAASVTAGERSPSPAEIALALSTVAFKATAPRKPPP
jgi:hypothetical protein